MDMDLYKNLKREKMLLFMINIEPKSVLSKMERMISTNMFSQVRKTFTKICLLPVLILIKKVRFAKLFAAEFLMEHNLPLAAAYCFGKSLMVTFPDSKVGSKFNVGEPKFLIFLLGPFQIMS